MKEIEDFYLQKSEPVKSCLLSLRDIILAFNPEITETWKYRMPIFCYRKKMFCYLWIDKKSLKPYVGIVEGKKIAHPKLIREKRARMSIMLIDPTLDIPVRTINQILRKAITFYK